jgi:hypothetical protein
MRHGPRIWCRPRGMNCCRPERGLGSGLLLGSSPEHDCRGDHHRLRHSGLGSQIIHHSGEDAFVAPPLPAVVEGLRRVIFLRRSAPPQAIAIVEEYPAQNPPINNARLAMAFGKEGLKPHHLRFGQPEKVAHGSVSSRRLNHAAGARTMRPDPGYNERWGRTPCCSTLNPFVLIWKSQHGSKVR